MKKSQLSKTVRMLKAEQILSTLSQCVNKYGPAQKMYLFPVLWIFHKNLFTLIEFFISYDAIYTHKELFCNQSTMKILNNHKLIAGCSAQKRDQEDPCKTKVRLVADVTYCDRYWECGSDNQPELYDCPNGLVFAGKHRGVTEGCDYPWRSDYCEGKQLASM